MVGRTDNPIVGDIGQKRANRSVWRIEIQIEWLSLDAGVVGDLDVDGSCGRVVDGRCYGCCWVGNRDVGLEVGAVDDAYDRLDWRY